jgi:hypothetical protein
MGRPPEFLQPLAQGRNACLSVRIVRSQHYYGEAPHTLGQDVGAFYSRDLAAPEEKVRDVISLRSS